MPYRFATSVLSIALAAAAMPAGAEDSEDRRKMDLGKLTVVAPKEWVRKEPASRIVAYEFATPAAKEDKADGRLTVMNAGGSIEANLERWYAQFSQEDGGDTKKRAKTEKTKVAGHTVHLVDISGTYRDQFKGTTHKEYRTLGAIIETKEGNFFIKLYGPKRTIAQHEKAFRAMVDGMKAD